MTSHERLHTLDWLVICGLVLVPMAAALVVALWGRRSDRRRWADSTPAERPGYVDVNARARW